MLCPEVLGKRRRNDASPRNRSSLINNSCSHDESFNCFGRFGNRPKNQITSSVSQTKLLSFSPSQGFHARSNDLAGTNRSNRVRYQRWVKYSVISAEGKPLPGRI